MHQSMFAQWTFLFICFALSLFLIQYAFALLLLAPCRHLFLFSPRLCFLLRAYLFVLFALLGGGSCCQIKASNPGFVLLHLCADEAATNFKRAQLAPYMMALCTMSLLKSGGLGRCTSAALCRVWDTFILSRSLLPPPPPSFAAVGNCLIDATSKH